MPLPAASRRPRTSLPFTRYDGGETIEDPARLRPAIEQALASGQVTCLDVILEPTGSRRPGDGRLAI